MYEPDTVASIDFPIRQPNDGPIIPTAALATDKHGFHTRIYLKSVYEIRVICG